MTIDEELYIHNVERSMKFINKHNECIIPYHKGISNWLISNVANYDIESRTSLDGNGRCSTTYSTKIELPKGYYYEFGNLSGYADVAYFGWYTQNGKITGCRSIFLYDNGEMITTTAYPAINSNPQNNYLPQYKSLYESLYNCSIDELHMVSKDNEIEY